MHFISEDGDQAPNCSSSTLQRATKAQQLIQNGKLLGCKAGKAKSLRVREGQETLLSQPQWF